MRLPPPTGRAPRPAPLDHGGQIDVGDGRQRLPCGSIRANVSSCSTSRVDRSVPAITCPSAWSRAAASVAPARHLRMRLDRRQRGAQFVRRVRGEAALPFQHVAHPREQGVQRREQGLHFARRRHRRRAASSDSGRTTRHRDGQPIERREALSDGEPDEQGKHRQGEPAADAGDSTRCRSRARPATRCARRPAPAVPLASVAPAEYAPGVSVQRDTREIGNLRRHRGARRRAPRTQQQAALAIPDLKSDPTLVLVAARQRIGRRFRRARAPPAPAGFRRIARVAHPSSRRSRGAHRGTTTARRRVHTSDGSGEQQHAAGARAARCGRSRAHRCAAASGRRRVDQVTRRRAACECSSLPSLRRR